MPEVWSAEEVNSEEITAKMVWWAVAIGAVLILIGGPLLALVAFILNQ